MGLRLFAGCPARAPGNRRPAEGRPPSLCIPEYSTAGSDLETAPSGPLSSSSRAIAARRGASGGGRRLGPAKRHAKNRSGRPKKGAAPVFMPGARAEQDPLQAGKTACFSPKPRHSVGIREPCGRRFFPSFRVAFTKDRSFPYGCRISLSARNPGRPSP